MDLVHDSLVGSHDVVLLGQSLALIDVPLNLDRVQPDGAIVQLVLLLEKVFPDNFEDLLRLLTSFHGLASHLVHLVWRQIFRLSTFVDEI